MVDPTLRILSLFSGIAGLDLGFERAARRVGLDPRTVGYVEREAFAVAVLAAAMDRGLLAPAPVWVGDVEQLAVPAADVVLAGFPCPPVSSAGARRGVEDERWLWPEVVRAVRDSGARWVGLENVRGLLSANGGRAFGSVLGDLADLGFDAEWTVLRASDVGAPHRRERVFLLAYRASGGLRDPLAAPQERGPAQRSGDPLGHAASIGEREPHNDKRAVARADPRAGLGGADVRLAGGTLADPDPDPDPDDERREGRRLLACRRPDQRPPRTSGGALADPDRHERRRRDGEPRRHAPEVGAKLAGWPLPFPPGPADRELWRRILDTDPELAPALEPDLRRVAHGLPARTDRLRALGNAVVIPQAEAAFLELFTRIPCSQQP